MKLSINSTIIVLALCFGVSAISADMNVRGEGLLLAALSRDRIPRRTKKGGKGRKLGKKGKIGYRRQLMEKGSKGEKASKRGRELQDGRELDKMLTSTGKS